MGSIKDIYEKAGLFYIGKDVDSDKFETSEVLTLLKNKNFTTHATIIGMTGSGKTGLGIGLLEEASIDNIPSIVIDPKGDMGNLLLADSEFKAETFAKWVEDEAKSKGEDPLELGSKTAKMWKDGINSWNQDETRVEKFASVDKTIYTPGSSAGVPINILSSLEKPNDAILNDSDNFTSYLSSTVNSLLALVGVEGGELDSKEYILLAQIISKAWRSGEKLSIESLVGSILQPTFKKIGVLPLESFYPQSDRFKLANKFNSVIASPAFMGWLQGESLDIQNMLYDKTGKAKVAIFSIAHLSDEQRMFFVTMLLNRVVAWMRMQSGSTRLKSLLYMDEIYGYFPPTKNPPSKEPMITLLKQARAYGLGVILSTQNPVDLDYKGLANIGTWFIGRLQTKQDIQKVIEGLSGKGDSLSKSEISNILSNLPKRTFFLKSSHLDSVRLFGTRWVMSYLKGPLKKDEISELMEQKKGQVLLSQNQEVNDNSDNSEYVSNIILDGVEQKFELDVTGKNRFFATIASSVSLSYLDSRRGVDLTKEHEIYIDVNDINNCSWGDYQELDESLQNFSKSAPKGGKFRHLPDFITEDKGFKKCQRELKEYLYANNKLELYKAPKLRLESKIDESYDDFTLKVQDVLQDKKEEEIDKLKDRFKSKLERLESQLTRALQQIDKEKSDQTSSLINAGISLIGALFGKTTVTKIGTAVNRSGRVLKERGDLSRAEEKVEDVKDKIAQLEEELEDKINEIDEKYTIDNYEIKTIFIKPKKSLIDINEITILWRVDF